MSALQSCSSDSTRTVPGSHNFSMCSCLLGLPDNCWLLCQMYRTHLPIRKCHALTYELVLANFRNGTHLRAGSRWHVDSTLASLWHQYPWLGAAFTPNIYFIYKVLCQYTLFEMGLFCSLARVSLPPHSSKLQLFLQLLLLPRPASWHCFESTEVKCSSMIAWSTRGLFLRSNQSCAVSYV